MKKVILLMLITLLYNVAVSQCYEPNIKKADAAYARGDWQRAYEFYKQASKCPDAKSFENGKKAKDGMKKCYPVLKVDGQKEINLTVGQEAGERTFKVTHSRLSDYGWWVTDVHNCNVTKEDHTTNTITIKWDENKTRDNRDIFFHVNASGVLIGEWDVSVFVTIKQQGNTYEIKTHSGIAHDTVVKGSSGISFVMKNGHYGFIDSVGRNITPTKYSYVESLSYSVGTTTTTYRTIPKMFWAKNDMLMRVSQDGKFGYIDQKGNEVVPLKYDIIEKPALEYGFSTTVVMRNGKFGLLNGNGIEIISCIYDSYEDFASSYYPLAFKKEKKWAIFDRKGKQITSFKYDWICRNGFKGYTHLLMVGINYKYGFINLNGDEVIPLQFESDCMWADFGDNNRAIIKQNGKFGYINSNGKVIVNCQYDEAKNYYRGLAWVRKGEFWTLIDTAGNVITQNSYREIYNNGLPSQFNCGKKKVSLYGELYYHVSRTGQGDTVVVGYYGKELQNDQEEQVEKELEIAAKKGIELYQEAMVKYYILHDFFKHDESDKAHMFEWQILTAQNGRPSAYTAVAKLYYDENNYIEAFKWFSKAANEFDAEAMAYLGWMLWKGQGCEIDKNQAIEWEHMALSAGYKEAFNDMKKLGMVLSDVKPY